MPSSGYAASPPPKKQTKKYKRKQKIRKADEPEIVVDILVPLKMFYKRGIHQSVHIFDIKF